METVVAVEGNDEAKVDNGASDAVSDPTSLKHIPEPDPVVYKLVRVDGDGRLVPATDDEVMVVEDLLIDDKNEVHFDANSGQPIDTTKRCSLEKAKYVCSVGQAGNLDVVAKVSNTHEDPNMEQREAKRVRKPTKRYIEESSEVGFRESSGRMVSSVKSFEAVDLGKRSAQQEETLYLLASRADGANISQSYNIEGCSSSQGGSIRNGSSTSAVGISCRPDFSRLNGEICLDNLTVKELQETFTATFGRETSVKDKQWLKRRIAMGLTNSCDISTTTFVIEDDKVVAKIKGDTCKSSATSQDLVAEVKNQTVGGRSDVCVKELNIHSNFDAKRPESCLVEYDSVSEDPNTEQRAAKRVRKPTKRYIEEISEVESRESGGRMVPSVKSSENGQPSRKAFVRPLQNVQPYRGPVITREDSFGGSGVQVPYVSRVRRGRPRENFMTLMELQPSDIGMAAKMVKKARGEPVRGPDDDTGSSVFKARLSPKWIEQPLISASGKGKHYLERKMELERDGELKSSNSFEDNSDDNMVAMPTPLGGMRRKHHRPWSLTEVVKLVEGVARYGAGRWSEIKRLAFASYSYRTSVDLKDKWRNLLRASLTQLPTEKGMQSSRKHASIPIPAPILLRVRELAEMQAQVPPNLGSSKFAGHSGGTDRSVQETRSGYL